jgi:hypothetical protein
MILAPDDQTLIPIPRFIAPSIAKPARLGYTSVQFVTSLKIAYLGVREAGPGLLE